MYKKLFAGGAMAMLVMQAYASELGKTPAGNTGSTKPPMTQLASSGPVAAASSGPVAAASSGPVANKRGAKATTGIARQWVSNQATAKAVIPPPGRVFSEITSAEKMGFHFLGSISGKNSTILVKILATNEIKAFKVNQLFLNDYVIDDIQEKKISLTKTNGKTILVHADAFAAGEDKAAVAKAVEAPQEKMFDDNFKEEGFERDKNNIKVSQDYWKKLINKDLSKILMQAGAEPAIVNGQITGFRIHSIEKDSIYGKAGLHDEDVISSINGTKLDNVGESVKLLQSLRNTPSVSVDVERGGQKTTVSIEVQ